MRLCAEGRPTHQDQLEVSAQEGADLVEDDLVADGRLPAALDPVELVAVAVVEELLEARPALGHAVNDVLVDSVTAEVRACWCLFITMNSKLIWTDSPQIFDYSLFHDFV